LARRRAQTISLVDLGKPANNAKNRIRPCLVRRAGHCVVARSLRIAADRLAARASHCPARRYHHFRKVFLAITLGAMNTTLVVVPTYNERENLPPMAQRLAQLAVPVDMLIVDGNSTDGTAELADELAARSPAIHVLHEKEKKGLGRAYCAAFKWGLERGYEFIMEMDGDFSHNPDDIPRFIEAAQNADLVLGSRYCGGIRVINWPLKRLLLSTGAARYVRIITGMPFTDPTGGFKCFRRSALQSIDLDAVRSNGYSFQIEMTHKLWRQGMKIVEIPIIFTERLQGHSKMSRKIVREALIMVWALLFQNGLRRSPRKQK
jgi:dolichol-phosphate mannosyltransferase